MSGPDPAVAAVRSAVRSGLSDLPAGSVLLVACSGGPDSLALAAATGFVAARAGWPAGAVVVDHGWSHDSADVARRAADSCRAVGLDPVEALTVDSAGQGGPEAAARAARYAALDGAARRLGAHAVLLGHTLDDQAETVLLGLSRGAGARSLAGMPARRGVYRRPLLGLGRAVTRQACAALGLQPWQDPANADPRYARVRARELLAAAERSLGPGIAEALARTAEQLREDADALDAAAELLAGGDVAALAAAPDAVRRRALLAAARQAGCPASALSRRHVLALDALVTRWRGQGPVHLPGRVTARRIGDRLCFEPG